MPDSIFVYLCASLTAVGWTLDAQTQTGTILDRIVEARRQSVAKRKRMVPLAVLRMAVEKEAPPRDFAAALSSDSINIIAEQKKASPSRGVLRRDFDPVALAPVLERVGAAALSVFTEEDFFQGSLGNLGAARNAVASPALLKSHPAAPIYVPQRKCRKITDHMPPDISIGFGLLPRSRNRPVAQQKPPSPHPW